MEMGIIIVGGVLKKDNKYLLVQEAQEKCRGKWNLPAGHLDPNETIFDGAKREIYEECGFNVNLTGIAYIANQVLQDNTFIGIVFSTEIIDGEINFNKNEILDVKWFSYDEILEMRDELRSYDWVVNAITAVKDHSETNISLIKVMK